MFQHIFRILHLFNIRILKTDVLSELSHNTGVCNKVPSMRLGPQCQKFPNFFPSLQVPAYIIYSLSVSLKFCSDSSFPLCTTSSHTSTHNFEVTLSISVRVMLPTAIRKNGKNCSKEYICKYHELGSENIET